MSIKNFTESQLTSLNRLHDIFIYGVKRLIYESFEEHVFIDDYRSEINITSNNLIVEFRYSYFDLTFILFALVDHNGDLFLPNGSKAECEIDYILVID